MGRDGCLFPTRGQARDEGTGALFEEVSFKQGAKSLRFTTVDENSNVIPAQAGIQPWTRLRGDDGERRLRHEATVHRFDFSAI